MEQIFASISKLTQSLFHCNVLSLQCQDQFLYHQYAKPQHAATCFKIESNYVLNSSSFYLVADIIC